MLADAKTGHVGVVVDLNQIGSPPQEHRVARVDQHCDRGLETAGPVAPWAEGVAVQSVARMNSPISPPPSRIEVSGSAAADVVVVISVRVTRSVGMRRPISVPVILAGEVRCSRTGVVCLRHARRPATVVAARSSGSAVVVVRTTRAMERTTRRREVLRRRNDASGCLAVHILQPRVPHAVSRSDGAGAPSHWVAGEPR